MTPKTINHINELMRVNLDQRHEDLAKKLDQWQKENCLERLCAFDQRFDVCAELGRLRARIEVLEKQDKWLEKFIDDWNEVDSCHQELKAKRKMLDAEIESGICNMVKSALVEQYGLDWRMQYPDIFVMSQSQYDTNAECQIGIVFGYQNPDPNGLSLQCHAFLDNSETDFYHLLGYQVLDEDSNMLLQKTMVINCQYDLSGYIFKTLETLCYYMKSNLTIEETKKRIERLEP